MEHDISKELPFEEGTKDTDKKPRVVADINDILKSDYQIHDLVLENGSVIEAQHLKALDYERVVKKYPMRMDILDKIEKNLLIKAYKKRGDDEIAWLNSLSEQELAVVAKVSNADTDVIPRTAMILSFIAVNPKLTEEQALKVLESFVDHIKLANFCAMIQKLTEANEEHLKNC